MNMIYFSYDNHDTWGAAVNQIIIVAFPALSMCNKGMLSASLVDLNYGDVEHIYFRVW